MNTLRLHIEEGRAIFLRKYKAYKVQVTSYDISIEHEIMETQRNAKIISRGFKLCGLYMLNGSTIFWHAYKTRQNMHDAVFICCMLVHGSSWTRFSR